MIHAWDQVSFSDSKNEELPYEISQQMFHERNLNRRIDNDILNCVNRCFERVFDLADNRYLTGKLKRLQLSHKVM